MTIEDQRRTLRRSLVSAGVLLALIVTLLLAIPGLSGVLSILKHAQLSWVLLAVALEFLSGVGYVLTFQLVFRRAPPRFAARLAWSELAFQGVVPLGGAGGLGLGAWVLHSVGAPTARIAERSAVFFILTSAINVFILVFFGLGLALGIFSGPSNPLWGAVPAAVGLVTIVAFLALPHFIERLAKRLGDQRPAASVLRGLGQSINDTEQLLRTPNWRLVGAFGYLLFDIAVLFVCFRALGQTPPVAVLVLGYQLGYLANIVPSPGGIGALDAGLVGMLVLYGINVSQAAAAVIIYHAIALWVPALLGTIAFGLLQRQLKDPAAIHAALAARRRA